MGPGKESLGSTEPEESQEEVGLLPVKEAGSIRASRYPLRQWWT